jgi:hypothetical protein
MKAMSANTAVESGRADQPRAFGLRPRRARTWRPCVLMLKIMLPRVVQCGLDTARLLSHVVRVMSARCTVRHLSHLGDRRGQCSTLVFAG